MTSLLPEVRAAAQAEAVALVTSRLLSAKDAKKQLWEAICEEMQPGGMKGDFDLKRVSVATVASAALTLRERLLMKKQ